MKHDEEANSVRTANSWTDDAIRLALVAFIFSWSFLLIVPFIAILIWAAILSVALYPVYLWLKRMLGERSALASFLLTVFALVVILGPVSAIGAELVTNLSKIVTEISKGTFTVPSPPTFIAELPLVGNRISTFWQAASVRLAETLAPFEPQIRKAALAGFAAAGSIGIGVLQFAVAIVISGFTYSRVAVLKKNLKHFAMRVAPQLGEGLMDLAEGTVRNVARGVVGISLIQSILFGLGAMVAGIPLVGLWTSFVLILAIVQVGPGLVIIPVVIFAWISMDTLNAAIMTAYMLPVMLMDNVLKPMVMGQGLPVPMLVIFIGVIGGTMMHGLIGLFVGPIVLSFGYELARTWLAMMPSSSDS